jgi:hypothetical protein
MNSIFTILVAGLLCVVTIFAIKFKTMENLWFVGLTLLLIGILWASATTTSLQESFEGTGTTSSDEKNKKNKSTSLNIESITKHILQLPHAIGMVIIPELDYMIDSIKQESSQDDDEAEDGAEAEDEDEDEVGVDADEYLSREDPDVTKVNKEGKTVIDKKKMGDLRETYADIDVVLKLLKQTDKGLYVQVLGPCCLSLPAVLEETTDAEYDENNDM